MSNLSGGLQGSAALLARILFLLLFLRPEQHHRHHRLHLQQRRRPQRQEGRGPQEPVQLRLVLLFWRPLLYRGRVRRGPRRQHLHREKQRDAISRPAQLHEEHLLFITVFSHPQLPVPPEALALQLTLHGSVSRVLPGGGEGPGRRAGDGGHIPVRPQQGAAQSWKRDDEALQPREGFWLFTGPQLLPERSKRWREQEDHAGLRAKAPGGMIPQEVAGQNSAAEK